MLKDPLLPDELLPPHWLGQNARQLCINIYQRVAAGSLAYVSELGETFPPRAAAAEADGKS